MTTLRIGTDLATIDCGKCCGTYAINERYRAQCEQEGRSWKCPYCGIGWGYGGNGENDRLKRELASVKSQREHMEARAERERERREAAERSASAMKGQVTKIKNRVVNGVCPCCNRHFDDLKRHMHSKHPNYNKAEG